MRRFAFTDLSRLSVLLALNVCARLKNAQVSRRSSSVVLCDVYDSSYPVWSIIQTLRMSSHPFSPKVRCPECVFTCKG